MPRAAVVSEQVQKPSLVARGDRWLRRLRVGIGAVGVIRSRFLSSVKSGMRFHVGVRHRRLAYFHGAVGIRSLVESEPTVECGV